MKLFTLLACLLVQSVLAQSNDTTSQIDKLFSSWNNSTPGGSVLVARGENILYHKAYGLANLESSVPNTTETIFEAGSVSKQFTAFSILLLNAEGKLALTDDARKYIPELPNYEAPITIQQLLNHTSGMKDWGSVGSLTGWPRGTRVYTLDLALQIMSKQKTTNFRPGSEYNYSNANYSLLVAIVERVSKQSLEDFTRERLFKPLGMTNTRWRSNFRDVVPNRAQAYSRSDKGYQLEMPFEHIYGHGGLLTTTGDLLKWNRILETYQIGGEAVFKKRIERGKLSNGKVLDYAAGLGHGDVNGVAEIGHSGATAGYRAWLAYYPSKKITIALLSNDANFGPYDAGRQIAEIYFGTPPASTAAEPKTIAFTEKDLQKWAGVYKSIREFDVFTFDRDGQQLVSNGHALKMSHPDTLFLDNLKWVYRKNGNITVTNWGDTATYRKVPPFDVRSTMSFSGDYFSDETGSGFSVMLKDTKPYIVNKPFEAKLLEPAFRDAFVMDGYILIEFKRNGEGKVSGFDISIPRAERVQFKKIK